MPAERNRNLLPHNKLQNLSFLGMAIIPFDESRLISQDLCNVCRAVLQDFAIKYRREEERK